MKNTHDCYRRFGRLLSLGTASVLVLCLGLILPLGWQPAIASTTAASSPIQNVNVVNSPTVTVGNTTANPVLVVSTPSAPFQQEVVIPFNDGSSGGSVSFDVPLGKRLVIEYVSGSAALDTGQQLFQTRIDTLQVGGGAQAGHYFTATFQGSRAGIGDYFSISEPTHLYAVGTVMLTAFRTDITGAAQLNLSVSGYLVNQ